MADSADGEGRATWGGKLDFILSSLGYAVGLGNIWRFPYYCGKNGGAAFFIPYLVMLAFCGVPMFYLELSIAQFSGKSPHNLFQSMVPLFCGLGACMICVSFYTSVYYNVVVAWAIYYFGISFKKPLPYSSCSNQWNSKLCFDPKVARECKKANLPYYSGKCHNSTNTTMLLPLNWAPSSLSTSPSKEYWENRVLRITSGIEYPLGPVNWELSLCLLAAWIIVAFILIKGIKSAGKAVYFTATFPYVIIFILIIRGVTLKGAGEGLKFYLQPDLKHLASSQVWSDAASQILFSLSTGMGGLATLSSYNDFRNNILRDTMIVIIGNCLTSFISGIAIFSILGHLSYNSGKSVAKLAASGPGLAFIAYPQALSEIPGSQVWSVMFFTVLIMLGINTEQVNVEIILTAIVDQWPKYRSGKLRALLTFGVCLVLFLLGIIMVTHGGFHVLEIMDHFGSGWPVILTALIESIVVCHVYGAKRLAQDIFLMLGKPTTKAWKLLGYPVNAYFMTMWLMVTPTLLIFVFLFSLISDKPLTEGDYTFPSWSQSLGWVITFSCLIPLFVGIVLQLHRYTQAVVDGREINLLKPRADWGPKNKSSEAKNSAVQEVEAISEINSLELSNTKENSTTVIRVTDSSTLAASDNPSFVPDPDSDA